jgi:predicted transcriptional regulator
MPTRESARLRASVIAQVTPETRKRLDAIAEAEERSVSAVVRQAIRQYLKRREGKVAA